MSEVMTIRCSAEARADCEACWARVRAGLHEPEAHIWRDDLGDMIARERALARACIEGAARHMRHVEELSRVDDETVRP